MIVKKDTADIAIYYKIIDKDTDKNGELNSDDLITLALTNPDGTQYTVIDSSVDSVMDSTIIKGGQALALLTQSDGKLHYKTYSLKTFKNISSRTLLNISAGYTKPK